ncbi:MAG TPA: PEGA domain-containing protein [Byssovorax sp.]|jgi:hypothetical protein
MSPVSTKLARACALGVALASAHVSAPLFAQAPPPASTDPADVIFRKGNEAYKAERYADAEALYLKAWELKQTYDIASNLGHAEMKVGKYRDAAEHLDFALRHHPPTGAQDKRVYVEAALAEARQKVGALKIKVNRVAAEVFVDGKLIGTAPLSVDVFVDPGAVRVEARLDGFQAASQRVEVGAGQSQEVSLDLSPAAPVVVATSHVEPPPPQKRSLVPVIVLGAVGVAGVALGVTGALLAGGKRGDADDTAASLKASGALCSPQTPGFESQCSSIGDDASSHSTLQVLSGVGFGVGAAGFVGAAAYLLWPRGAAPQTTGLAVAPWSAKDGGGLSVRGSF